jgi:hypothetical protein
MDHKVRKKRKVRKMIEYEFKDILVRAVKTFFQALFASLAVAQVTDSETLKAALIAGVAAGISAVWNTLVLINDIRRS